MLLAASAQAAIEQLRKEPVDVVLTDLMMPGMSGQELLRAVRAVAPETEVVLMTAYGTVEAAVAAMARAVKQRFGTVDVLINNAGKYASAPLTSMSVAEFDQQIAANLRSVFLVTRAFLPAMIKRRSGDIFNMSSIAGLIAYPGGTGYSAAKFGLTGLSKVMRAELKDKGVRVCCVYPGATASPSWKGSGVSAGRMMPAEDVARAFLDIYRLSRRTVVEEIILRPQRGDL